ncbi:ParB family protein [Cellulomonas denverensis]|uniref:ParB family protein n=1 Tax=Cellulomonas denverensis TaxID=264297 RepID=UPI0035EA7A61
MSRPPRRGAPLTSQHPSRRPHLTRYVRSPRRRPASTPRARRRGAARNPADYLVGQKATTSLQIYLELKARAETAVLRTAGQEGGVRSLTALVNEALAREVIRLEEQFNAGEPFEPNRGAFRMGRPFGS